MQGALLGPEYSDEEIEAALKARGAVYRRLDFDSLMDFTVESLKAEKAGSVGCKGGMEFRPAGVGQSVDVLGDARSPRMQSVMNLKVKFRESFRPFAPIVRRERVGDYFELEVESPYMLLVAPVKEELRDVLPPNVKGLDL